MSNKILGCGGIHHVAVRTAEMEKSIAFYTGVLGMSVAADFDFEGARFVHLDTGDGSLLELCDDGKPIAPADDRNVHWHLCFGTTRIAEAMKAATDAGCEVTLPVTRLDLTNTANRKNEAMPISVAFFVGPSGEVVELLQEHDA